MSYKPSLKQRSDNYVLYNKLINEKKKKRPKII